MAATIFRISNDDVSLAVNDKAELIELKNLETNHNYAGSEGLWRMVYSHKEVMEEEFLSEKCSPKIDIFPSNMKIEYIPDSEPYFSVKINISLDGHDILFSAELENKSDKTYEIREFNFPSIRNISLDKDQSLFGFGHGNVPQRMDDVKAGIESYHSNYVAEDNHAVEMPWAVNGFTMFANQKNCLYLGDHDSNFDLTTHLFRKRKEKIDASFHRSPFLKRGQKIIMNGYVISPLAGDWHVGARRFREWANTWYKVRPKPHSLSDGFNGWYRIIMRHQYGKILFRHDDLPKILKSMKETGINTLFIFGWWQAGMDAGYPDYSFDESQGGHDKLKEHFRKFRADGGKIILYFNGRLMDTSSNYYKQRGKDIAIQGYDGINITESYPFAGPGIDLRHQFGFKSFALACPHSQEWMDMLKSYIDIAIELEVDGVFFDQIGKAERPCFNPNHGHEVPICDGRAQRMNQLEELRKYLSERNDNMSFGIECLNHFTAPYVDYFHSFPGWNIAVNDWQGKREKPQLSTFVELFRYTFPEIPVSDREIRDDRDVERRVNLALLRGLVSDVEVHRCRSLIDETPHYKAYLIKANRLRDKYRRLILNGLFCDTEGAACDNAEISYSVFRAEDELAVIMTQSHLNEVKTNIHVPGYSFSEYDFIGSVEFTNETENQTVTLCRHSLIVITYKKII